MKLIKAVTRMNQCLLICARSGLRSKTGFSRANSLPEMVALYLGILLLLLLLYYTRKFNKYSCFFLLLVVILFANPFNAYFSRYSSCLLHITPSSSLKFYQTTNFDPADVDLYTGVSHFLRFHLSSQ